MKAPLMILAIVFIYLFIGGIVEEIAEQTGYYDEELPLIVLWGPIFLLCAFVGIIFAPVLLGRCLVKFCRWIINLFRKCGKAG